MYLPLPAAGSPADTSLQCVPCCCLLCRLALYLYSFLCLLTVFVAQLLARCIRLGGYERFAEEDQSSRSIPASLRNCLPPAPNPGASEESDSFNELQTLVKKGDERAVVEFVDQNYTSRLDSERGGAGWVWVVLGGVGGAGWCGWCWCWARAEVCLLNADILN